MCAKKKDELGDRLKKFYESDERFMPGLPVYVRLDGKTFSSYTHGLPRPDENFARLMIEVTRFLVEQTNARVGYTQSDEISLLLYAGDNPRSQLIFDGRKNKILSVFAAWAASKFSLLKSTYLPGFKEDLAIAFDCKADAYPNLIEATNAFVWREQDATKNSITMLAQNEYSHDQLDRINTKEMIRMLEVEKNIFWDTYPTFFKRGTYIQRKTHILPVSLDASDELIMVERSSIVEIDMPILTRVQNRVGVLVFGEEPETASEELSVVTGSF